MGAGLYIATSRSCHNYVSLKTSELNEQCMAYLASKLSEGCQTRAQEVLLTRYVHVLEASLSRLHMERLGPRLTHLVESTTRSPAPSEASELRT